MKNSLNNASSFKSKTSYKHTSSAGKTENLTVTDDRGLSTTINWSDKLKHFLLTVKNIFSSLLNSFFLLKKNFFNFGLEIILLTLAVGSLIFNFVNSPATFMPSENKFLSYLISHPNLNNLIVDKLKTEKIHLSPERERLVATAEAASLDPLIDIGTSQLVDNKATARYDIQNQIVMSADSVIVKPNFYAKDAAQRKDIQEYTVRNGDSVGKIASNFGVSIQTILYENKLSDDDYIKPGQVLKILPTTGIKHEVKTGETLEKIAKKYKVDVETILDYNEIEIPEDIIAGEMLIIPDGKVEIPTLKKSTDIASLNKIDIKQVNLPGEFAGASGDMIWPLPTRNVTQYYWSKHRALDISNGERPQFWSSNDGIVELSGWQAGYGRTIVVNHGNGYKTRYAHASELYVSAGDKVTKGQVLGRVGNTGRTYGRTGNHLHFEVMKNGVKINPLQVVR